jgi:RNA polymerase sigma-32 factor
MAHAANSEVVDTILQPIAVSTAATFVIPIVAPNENDPIEVAGLSSGGAFAVYASQIRQIPLLTPARERELARTYRETGDRRAHDLLVTSNLRFVVQIARNYRSYGRRMADMVQEGNLGLLRAVERYDPDRDIRLVSYAVWWIRAHIQTYILRTWSMVKLGTTQGQRRVFYALARTQRELARHGDQLPQNLEPSELATVAGRLGVSQGVVVETANRIHGRDVSLDAPLGDDGSTHLESMASSAPAHDDVMEGAQEQELIAARVAAALAQLDPRERTIIESRVMSDSPMTFEAVGILVGCSPERARQLETRAKAKLRQALEATAATG